ncbi:MAG: hypothetical protein V1688_00190 [bacterium]
MKKQSWKIFMIILLVLSVYFFTAGFVFNASAQLQTELNKKLTDVGISANYDTNASQQDIALATYVGKIINYSLSMLGVIFLALLVYGGFIWMLAKGDSEEVTKSKDIIINAVIGIVVVLISYAITYYVVANLANTTMTGGGFAP